MNNATHLGTGLSSFIIVFTTLRLNYVFVYEIYHLAYIQANTNPAETLSRSGYDMGAIPAILVCNVALLDITQER